MSASEDIPPALAKAPVSPLAALAKAPVSPSAALAKAPVSPSAALAKAPVSPSAALAKAPAPAPLETQPMIALGPVRHACHSCGTCCTGWRVQLPTLTERRRVHTQAEELGIADPIVDGVIRRVDGSCVFLREDKLCAIHAHFGEAEKPEICRHFPRRSRHAEDGVRIGADPGCTSTWKSFADGPLLEMWPVRTSKASPIASELAASEHALLQLRFMPGMTVALYIAVLTGDHSHLPNPGPEFATRIFMRLSTITPYLGDGDNGPLMNALLAPLAHFLATFENAPVPAWNLPPKADAFALEVLGRHLFLRLGDDTIPPMAQTLLVLGGILACGYIDPTPSLFGPALSAWSRMCRLEKFWLPALPDRATAEWVLHGAAKVTPPAP